MTGLLGLLGFSLAMLGTGGVLLAVLRAAARDDESLARQERALYLKRLRAHVRTPDSYKWWGDAE